MTGRANQVDSLVPSLVSPARAAARRIASMAVPSRSRPTHSIELPTPARDEAPFNGPTRETRPGIATLHLNQALGRVRA
jgi:hypothetical protein